MNIGIVTMYYKSKNCGGLLQAFALQRVIEKLGGTSEQLCYLPEGLSEEQKEKIRNISKRKRKYLILNFIKNPLLCVNKLLRTLKRRKTNDLDIKDKLAKQDEVFSEFEEFIPHSSMVYTEENIENANNKYDAFVCGSDQVWHLNYLVYKGYFLRFASKDKICVPYAVSTGKINMIPIERDQLRENIKRFDGVSVRERSYGELIKSIYTSDVSVVLDPTLLIPKEEWEKVENKACVPQEKYLFVYLLGDTKWHREKIQKFASERNMKIVHLPYIMKQERPADVILKGEGRWNVGPREFLALIHYADCVFTDSFHAMAFSVVFKKEFFVFDRFKMSNKDSMNFRVSDFLRHFNMPWRHITARNDTFRLNVGDYIEVEKQLEEDREKSLDFLKKNLSL